MQALADKKRSSLGLLTLAILVIALNACSSSDTEGVAADSTAEPTFNSSYKEPDWDREKTTGEAASIVGVNAQTSRESETTPEGEPGDESEPAEEGDAKPDTGNEADSAGASDSGPLVVGSAGKTGSDDSVVTGSAPSSDSVAKENDTTPPASGRTTTKRPVSTTPDAKPTGNTTPSSKPPVSTRPDTKPTESATPAAQPKPPLEGLAPDLVFDWTAEARPTGGSRLTDFAGDNFWIRGINCSSDYIQAHSNSTRVTFGVTSQSRFAGERSVEFFSDRSQRAPCNDHVVSHRAEMSLSNNRSVNNRYAKYRNGGGTLKANSPTLGVDTGSVGSPGSVMWFGWSERYGQVDTSNSTTLWQLRSNCGTGSPAVSLVYRPDSPFGKGKGIYLLTNSGNGDVRDNYNLLAPLATGRWRDFVMEVGYSYEDKNGFVKVWHRVADSNGRSTFDYNNPAVFRRSATLFGADAPLPANANNVDECPHVRWGLYRHDGSKVSPEQVPEANRVMTKYMSPVRLLAGRGLGQQGLDAVTPRPVAE